MKYFIAFIIYIFFLLLCVCKLSVCTYVFKELVFGLVKVVMHAEPLHVANDGYMFQL